jgi:hypothetical protein
MIISPVAQRAASEGCEEHQVLLARRTPRKAVALDARRKNNSYPGEVVSRKALVGRAQETIPAASLLWDG